MYYPPNEMNLLIDSGLIVIPLIKNHASVYIIPNIERTFALSIVIALVLKWYLIASTTRSASITSTLVWSV